MWNVFLYVALFFYKWFRWAAAWLKAARGRSTQVFLVEADGEQVPLRGLAHLADGALLVKFYSGGEVRYRFAERTGRQVTVFSEPKRKMLGLSVTVGEKTYPLDANEFNVGASTLFTPHFNRWLCRNYLRVPDAEVTATVIDADVNILCSKEPLYLN